MASPFKLFRKYQGVLLAVFGVALMIAFVVFPAIIQMQQGTGGRGGGNSDAVFTWVRGDMTAQDISERGTVRQLTMDFLREVVDAAQKEDDEAQIPAQARAVLGFLDDSPQGVVFSMLVAEKARQNGIVISDNTIYQFLYQLSNNVLSATDIDQIYASWKEDRKSVKRQYLPKQTILATLREALLAYQMDQLAQSGLEVTTPAQAWEYHNRIHRRVNAEFVPFKVDDFLSQVTADPSTSELKKLYEKHKYDDPVRGSAEPGFHRRERVELHYVMGDLDDFVKQEKANITRQQIEQYYKENKDEFLVPSFDDFGDLGDFGDPPADVTGESGQAQPNPRDAVPNPPQPVEDEPAKDGENGDSPAPTNQGAESGANTSNGQAAGNEGADGDTGESGEIGDDLTPNIFSFNDDDLLLPGELPDRRREYKPLEEVEDVIRTKLANEVALKLRDEAIENAQDSLHDYFDGPYFKYETEQGPKPDDFDYQPVAKEFGLHAGNTGLVDALTLSEDKEQSDFSNSYRIRTRGLEGLFQIVYQGKPPRPYEAIITDNGNKRYLSWVVAHEDAYAPEFDEIRDEVVEAWKRQQARDLAEQAAESLMSKVAGDKSLKGQVPAGTKVLAPAPFNYVDEQSLMMFRIRMMQRQPMPLELSEIQSGSENVEDEPIENAQYDALKSQIARMNVGDLAVIPNEEKSIYYLVRVAGENIDDEQLREDFIQRIADSPQGVPQDFLLAGGRSQRAPYGKWREQLEDEFGAKLLDEDFFTTRGSRR